jgi:hypothetical protein
MKFVPTALALACFVMAFLCAPRLTIAQSLKWKYPTGGQVQSSAVLGPDGTLPDIAGKFVIAPGINAQSILSAYGLQPVT